MKRPVNLHKSLLTVMMVCVLLVPGSAGWRRRRRGCGPVNCVWGGWSAWTPCNHPCGNAGTQTRSRGIAQHASCGGAGCHGPYTETVTCNRFCYNGGSPMSGFCTCTDEFTGTCCRNRKLSLFLVLEVVITSILYLRVSS